MLWTVTPLSPTIKKIPQVILSFLDQSLIYADSNTVAKNFGLQIEESINELEQEIRNR